MSTRTRALVAGALVACLFAVVAGQAVADSAAPRGLARDTGMAMGRAGAAFTEGLRVFAAVVIWNRLDPQVHDYYGGTAIRDMVWLVPNLRLVTILDPDFQQAYYVLPWILGRNGKVADAVDVAREGVHNNPHAGMLWASYAQILQVLAKDDAAALAAARRTLGSDITWTDPRLEYEGLRMVASVLRATGHADEAARVDLRIKEVERQIRASGLEQKAKAARAIGSESEDPTW